MTDIINLLPDSVANQIAAGEVVDRPASAVKEMLENAMDAGATAIQLIVKDAGRSLIQVVDNGCGMSDNDARLCFERHATSKIHQADDLFAIHTMGFRGEALASIAAVAQVELRSRQHDNDLGTQVIIEGSDVKSQDPCTCAAGTSIAVKNLFYNIPARRNFLKKDTIELSHIDEIFRRVALVNYQTAFSFHSNGKLLYDLHVGNFAQRIAGIFGNNYKERLFPVDENTPVVKVKGFVCKPEYVRRTRGEQYLFVNGRFIKHAALSAAVEKAYSELIPDRSYPSYFLCLEVDPARIDVNIHPAKTEVRFEDERALFAILRAATKKALGQFGLATEIEFDPSPDIDFSPTPAGYNPSEPKVSFNPNYNPFESHSSSSPSSSGVGGLRTGGGMSRTTTKNPWESFFDQPQSAEHNEPDRGAGADTLFDLDPEPEHGENSAEEATSQVQPMQFQNRYIVTSMKSGLVVIDQHRAHERIIYERLMRRNAIQSGSTGSQQLLFPINCSFSPSDAEIMGEVIPDLRNMGFDIAPLGQCTFVVSATPADVEDTELQRLFDNMLSDYKGSMIQKFNNRDQGLCQALARQMAVRQGKTLAPEEMQNLIAELFSCQVPNISPSGKKTMIIINDLDEKFR